MEPSLAIGRVLLEIVRSLFLDIGDLRDACWSCLFAFDCCRHCSHITDCLGSIGGHSPDANYEATLADNEREAVAELLQYLENVRLAWPWSL
jgi:hypothetical protein